MTRQLILSTRGSKKMFNAMGTPPCTFRQLWDNVAEACFSMKKKEKKKITLTNFIIGYTTNTGPSPFPPAVNLVLAGIWATWAVIAMLINLTTALVYPGGLNQTNCCIASLTLLVICHATWFILENFVFDKYARCVPYPSTKNCIPA